MKAIYGHQIAQICLASQVCVPLPAPDTLQARAPHESQVFYCSFGLKEGATELKLFQAADEASRNFDLYCKTLSNSDPSAFEDTEIDKLAARLLAQRGLERG